MAVIVKIRPFYGTVFGVYDGGTLLYTTRRQYGRNTVATERVIYYQYTVVNITFTDVFVNINGRQRSFTGVVMVGLVRVPTSKQELSIYIESWQLYKNVPSVFRDESKK